MESNDDLISACIPVYMYPQVQRGWDTTFVGQAMNLVREAAPHGLLQRQIGFKMGLNKKGTVLVRALFAFYLCT